MADLDTTLMKNVLDVAQRQRVCDLEHHCQAADFGASFEEVE